jgi:hypothetical protein
VAGSSLSNQYNSTRLLGPQGAATRAGVESLAHAVWAGINLPNLREHIGAVRASADLVVSKGADHEVVGIKRASLGERGN